MAPIRMSGMNSGLDTEAIVKAMVMGYESKKQKVEGNKTKLEWSQEIWKGVNSKVYSLYTSTDKVRFSGSYKSKKTTVSDATKASVSAGTDAVTGTQKLRIEKLASSGYLTGAKIKDKNGNTVTGDTRMSNMGIENGTTINVQVGSGTPKGITIEEGETISSFVDKLRDAGVNASFDTSNGRFFISSKESGAANDFTLTSGSGENGNTALKNLGLVAYSESDISNYQSIIDKYDGKNFATEFSTWAAAKDDITRDTTAKNNKIADKEYVQAYKDYVDSHGGALPPTAENATEADEEDEFYKIIKAYEESEGKDEALVNEVRDGFTAVADGDDEAAVANQNLLNSITGRLDSDIADLTSSIEANQATVADYETNFSDVLTQFNKYYNADDATKNAAVKSANDYIKGLKDIVAIDPSEGATKSAGSDAIIYLNGAQFTSDSNTFDINGLKITATATTGTDEISITTGLDVDGIYDKFKDFLSQYNDVINELQSLFNAESAKGYNPLTEEQKEEMSETEIEKWETKIKDSLLRRDTTLSGIINTMTMSMSKSYSITLKDGTTENWGLASVGVHTLGFLNAKANEQYAYHIDGDEDDENTSGKTDKLRAFIESDPDAAADLLSQVTQGFYSALGTKIGSRTTENSSAYTLYNDKQMKRDLDQYTKDIKEWEDRIATQEDFYYNKFTAMEKALASINSSQSALTGMFS